MQGEHLDLGDDQEQDQRIREEEGGHDQTLSRSSRQGWNPVSVHFGLSYRTSCLLVSFTDFAWHIWLRTFECAPSAPFPSSCSLLLLSLLILRLDASVCVSESESCVSFCVSFHFFMTLPGQCNALFISCLCARLPIECKLWFAPEAPKAAAVHLTEKGEWARRSCDTSLCLQSHIVVR